MKRFTYILGAVVYIMVGLSSSAPVYAASDDPRFKQWIAPLECTRDEIINGVSETYILTPEECYDFLNPEPPPVDPVDPGEPPVSPNEEGQPTGPYLSVPFFTDRDLDDPFQWQGRQLIRLPQDTARGLRSVDTTKQPECKPKPLATCGPVWNAAVVGSVTVVVTAGAAVVIGGLRKP